MLILKFQAKLKPVILLLVFVLAASPVFSQRRPIPRKPAAAPPVEPVVTFDTLLNTDCYRLYSEVRNVGQLVRSGSFNDLLEPIIKLSEPPKEFKTLLKWLNTHAESLSTSRLFAASWPTRSQLPTILIAVEFATPEEAKKFDAELRSFMPKLMPKPTPSPAGPPGTVLPAPGPPAANAPNEPQYVIKQTGALVLLTDKTLVLRDLKPRGSHLLVEDPNFSLARNRLASESAFIYFDVQSIEKEQQEQRKKWEEEELKRREAEAANPPAPEIKSTEVEATPEVSPEFKPVEEPSPSVSPEEIDLAAAARDSSQVDSQANPSNSPALDGGFFSLGAMLFGGQPKWPDAVAVGIAFEDEGYVVRALLVNGPENKTNAIPFVPQFVSGPAIVLGSPAVLPADTELFVSLSLDYAQIYDGMVKSMARAAELSRRPGQQPVAEVQPASPFAAYEKVLGLKVKDDILPLLGSELALALPKKQPTPTPSPSPEAQGVESQGPTAVKAPDMTPIIAIGVRDKEAVRKLIPKLVEALGAKGANLFAHSERRGETEIVSYADIFAYAFIGDFLVITPDAALTRHVVNSYLENQTLASETHFRNATRWQPRQVQGQVYAGPGLIDLVNPLATGGPPNEKLQELLLRLNPVIDPLTYALSNDSIGPLHELHIPKNLLVLMVAGLTNQAGESPIVTNESIARSLMQTIASAEATYKSATGKGSYGSLEDLIKEGLIAKDLFDKYGYRFELNVLSNKFEATAVPIEYGKSGRVSYFVDESGVLRGGDHGGGPATIADRPVE